ncbi:hypothetical protein JIQ42_04836 [Leishmania sp. Namibia]|uniref:hypothetical protein n=1 Tax=Leishmania sp. Namibia TaxID=2802991 RepID=UPI001B43088F|nr:hypothetical protein JIQ42_04836 [Leishmania sp. Namibia]
MLGSHEINERAAEAMRRADNATAEEYLEEAPHPESGTTPQQRQQQNEAAAEAMRRADVAYTRDDEV